MTTLAQIALLQARRALPNCGVHVPRRLNDFGVESLAAWEWRHRERERQTAKAAAAIDAEILRLLDSKAKETA